MDWLETLLPLLIFIVYFLSQLRKRRPAAPPPEAEPAPASRAPTPFEELIRQIQQAAEERAAPTAEPAPSPTPAPRPARPAPVPPSRGVPEARPVPQARLERAPESHTAGSFDHDRHGFGAQNPFSEEAFERQPLGAPPPPHAEGHLGYDPHRPLRPQTPRPAAPEHRVVRRLREPGGIREAFVLQAILTPPHRRARRP